MDESNKKYMVLIVEDEVSLATALHEKFISEGFSVLEAHDGEEGLEIALAKKPDCILLDIIMPKMDGITMLKHLRVDPWGKKAKVIMLTNLSDSTQVASAMEQDAFEFLVKSDVKIEEIVSKVRELL